MTSSVPSVVVFSCGNLSRGDDAIGPVLHERLMAWLDEEGLSSGFELVYDYQLQIEHALDLNNKSLALFIDAGVGTPAPFSFYPAEPETAIAHTSHSLTPGAVLSVWLKVEKKPPPPAFILCVRGESFGLGVPMSEAGRNNLEAAFSFVRDLCRTADRAAWERRCAYGATDSDGLDAKQFCSGKK